MISSQDTLAHIPFCGSGLQCARAESDHYLRNNAKYNMAAAAGHLVIFDQSGKPWKEKAFHRGEEFDGTPVEVWGV